MEHEFSNNLFKDLYCALDNEFLSSNLNRTNIESCENGGRNIDLDDTFSSEETLQLGDENETTVEFREAIRNPCKNLIHWAPPRLQSTSDLQPHELLVQGTNIHSGIVPGFKYRVRLLNSKKWLFQGKPLLLLSTGMGYGKRITFASDKCNDNENYFWSDNYINGYGFNISVVAVGDKFTIRDANHQVVGKCYVVEIQEPQIEIDQEINEAGQIIKHVQLDVICNVEWYEYGNSICHACHVSGIAAVIGGMKLDNSSRIIQIRHARVANHGGLTLEPGVNDKARRINVSGACIGDIPLCFTISGLEAYELPVIGTYVDPRIVPGFFYKVRPAHRKKSFFNGRALCLQSIGTGYCKRITFKGDTENNNNNFFWSDSYPDGMGFSIQAVFPGMKFTIQDSNRQTLGQADVYLADTPQIEEDHCVLPNGNIRKLVRVDVTCHLTFDADQETRTLGINGMAVVEKVGIQGQAKVLSIDNIGLASQLFVMFVHRRTLLRLIPV